MKPLVGTRVLDFTQVLAGPLCTQYLGDLGADVIKVEPVGKGDDTRQWPPFREGLGAVFLNVNRNKRSLALNLKDSASRSIVRSLVETSDVVVESFAGGVTERLGIDYETLRSINPRLIYCSVSGYGRSGPMKDARGYDLILQAYSGILSMTGHPGTGPTRVPLSPIDQGTGMHALSGILAALISRASTGKGCFLEVSLLETAVGLLGFNLESYWARGQLPGKSGSGHESLCPYQVFHASDDLLLVGIANNNHWERFCKLAGRHDLLADRRFETNATRVAHFDITVGIVQDIIATRTRSEWLTELQKIGVPCSPVNTLAEVMNEPQVKARGIIVGYDHPQLGRHKAIAHPIQFDNLAREVRLPPPRLGEHTAEILRELGLGEADIGRLRETSTIETADTREIQPGRAGVLGLGPV